MVSKVGRDEGGIARRIGDGLWRDGLWRDGCQTGNGHCQDISANKDGETAVSDLDCFGAIFLSRYLDSNFMFQKGTIEMALFEVAIHIQQCLKS